MKKNVGQIDRVFRFFFGLFLLWFGLMYLEGIDGKLVGIVVTSASLIPFTMSLTATCPVFHWLKINSLTKKEREKLKDSALEKER